ncbi:MAG: ATP-binding protein [bacterium]|nr:MAG: ATP-binding protein [bacterium]
MNAKYNPFYYGGIIKESRLFVGRKREVAEIVEAIATSTSVSIIGERRIGKSSLLRYLADPSVEQKNGLDISRYVFSYFDFLGYPSITPTEL